MSSWTLRILQVYLSNDGTALTQTRSILYYQFFHKPPSHASLYSSNEHYLQSLVLYPDKVSNTFGYTFRNHEVQEFINEKAVCEFILSLVPKKAHQIATKRKSALVNLKKKDELI